MNGFFQQHLPSITTMTLKRRRERDKPKAGPDALYNPNKRMLLSYASDEEDEDITDASEKQNGAAVDERSIANYQMEEYPDEEEEDVKLGAERPVQRDAKPETGDNPGEEQEDEGEERPSQNRQNRTSKKWANSVKRNERTNQYPQLGLMSYQWDEEDEEEEYDSTTEEAMAYLRAVR